MMFEIMNDGARCSNCRRHFRAAKTIERFGFEMFAQRERPLFRQKGVAVVAEGMFDRREIFALFLAHQNFGWRDPGHFIRQRPFLFQLHQTKFAGG